MSAKGSKSRKVASVRNMSARGIKAAKAFKSLKVAATPAKLRGKKALAIDRAIRGYYLA